MSVSSEFRDRKSLYYQKPIPGYKAYINFFMPVISVCAIWGLILDIINWTGEPLSFTLAVLYAVLAVIATLTARGADTLGFWCNLIFLAFFLVNNILSTVFTLISAAALSSAANGAAASAGLIGSYVASFATLGVGIALVPMLIGFVLVVAFVAFYLVVFIRHHRYFLTDLRDLKKQYDRDIEDD